MPLPHQAPIPGRNATRIVRAGRTARAATAAIATALLGSACLISSGPTSAQLAAAKAAAAAKLCNTRIHQVHLQAVKPDTNLDNTWNAYINTNQGWTDGDSVYAYSIGGGKTLWTYSDSFIGGLLPGTKRTGLIIHNLAVIVGPHGAQTLTGGTKADPQPLVGPGHENYFYLGLGGILSNPTTFQQIYMDRQWTGPEPLDHVNIGSVIATLSLTSDKITKLTPVPDKSRKIQWGAYVARYGGWTYIYGATSDQPEKDAYVARTASTSLDSSWSYWDGHGWAKTSSRAKPILDHVWPEYSVTPYDGMYLLISSSGQTFSPEANIWFGCSPIGPFSAPESFVVNYFVGPIGRKLWGDSAVIDYDVKAQPAAATGNQLIISYDQNSLHFYSIYNDDKIYRPSYLQVTLTFEGNAAGH